MDSQMQRDREAKADEAINAINRKAGRNMPQAVGTAIALIAIILLCLWASPILFVVLVVLFQLRPAWLLSAFNAVLGALALFQPFTDFVGGMFSVTGIVYYLSVAGLFLFLTGQALERRRWN